MSSADLADDGAAATPDVPAAELRHGVPVSWSRGQQVLHPSIEQYPSVVDALHTEGFLMCADLTAVDYLTYEPDRDLPTGIDPERFELVVSLLKLSPAERVRLRIQVPADDPTVPSIFERYPGSDAMEREVFDMFGIVFEGHPDLTRILMPEDWVGHPLRKDFSSGRIPVQFKDAPSAR